MNQCSSCHRFDCCCYRDIRSGLVAVLFARADSIYKTMPVDVWDEERDARRWPGGSPLVAHPPCRGWGRLRQFSYATEDERQLARDAVAHIRRFGGVLEHPAESTLWADQRLPRPGQFPDEHGGWSMAVDQFIFGHRAEKATWLYIVGCEPDDIPHLPIRGGSPTHCVRPTKAYPRLPSITKREREATPPEFAAWLVELARSCRSAAASPHPERSALMNKRGQEGIDKENSK